MVMMSVLKSNGLKSNGWGAQPLLSGSIVQITISFRDYEYYDMLRVVKLKGIRMSSYSVPWYQRFVIRFHFSMQKCMLFLRKEKCRWRTVV